MNLRLDPCDSARRNGKKYSLVRVFDGENIDQAVVYGKRRLESELVHASKCVVDKGHVTVLGLARGELAECAETCSKNKGTPWTRQRR